MTTTLQHWQGRITAVAFTSLTGAFGLNLAIGQFIAPLMDSLAWSLAATSTVVAVNTLAWGLFQPLAGRLIDRIGPRQVMAGSASLMGLSYVTLATVTEYWQFLILFGVVVAAGFAGCSSNAFLSPGSSMAQQEPSSSARCEFDGYQCRPAATSPTGRSICHHARLAGRIPCSWDDHARPCCAGAVVRGAQQPQRRRYPIRRHARAGRSAYHIARRTE